jgi:hypothetical protein
MRLELFGVNIDDLVIGAENEPRGKTIISPLQGFFKLTDLRVLKNIIGWEIGKG